MVLKHYLQRPLLENIKNLWAQFTAWQRAQRNTTPQSGPYHAPADYHKVFEDQFEKLDWEAWRTGHPWGRNVHPDWQWKWWPHRSELTKYKVLYPTPDGLALELRNFPRTFNKSELPKWQQAGAKLDQWSADYAMGCISTKKSYQYGWFEAEVKIPNGKGQWAAFWLSGSESWPPEIDVFETYHRPGEKLWAKPNVHFGTGNHWTEGKRDMGQPLIPLKNAPERWIKYAVHWTPDFIKFYYDGYLVQEFTNKKAIKQNRAPQYIILNNGCENPKDLGFEPSETFMLVRNIKVYQDPKWIDMV